MRKWNSSPHPISDLKDWNELHRLEINPEFQRGSVWSDAAKIMLIDSILNEIPMPKILVSKKIIKGSTHRIIIDGQQRTKTILSFINNEFKLKAPYQGEKIGKYFKDFTQPEQEQFLSYQIDFNESQGLTDQELRDVYSRLNKYTFALNKQELRRADFPGDFLTLSQDLANIEDFEDFRLFTAANKRRLNDVEYISEILSAFIAGPQDKKNNLDNFYLEYTDWPEKELFEGRLLNSIRQINYIFDETFPLAKTRFKQKSDFYSLIIAIDKFLTQGYEINPDRLESVRSDLKIVDRNVSPSSDVNFFNLYAEKCLASANTLASRNWRIDFISLILKPLFKDEKLSGNHYKVLVSIFSELPQADHNFSEAKCDKCGEEHSEEKGNLYITWGKDKEPGLSNFYWSHKGCFGDNINYINDENLYEIPENLKDLSKLV